MEMKSAGCVVGVLVTLLSLCFSQPVIGPSYYYSGGFGAGISPYGTDPRTAAAFSGYGYGTDAAALAAAAVAGYPYTNSYYYNPSSWTAWGYPNTFDWGTYLPTDSTGWNSFIGALPGDIRSSWNSFYSLYGSGAPNAANLWGRFIGQLPTNLLSTWQNWWGQNYARRWNTVRMLTGWPIKKK